ncbi:MAG: 30S ribosomal protein S18 [Rickettsiales bacterium]|nr:MAG: 30S ribosomal protein S18 [Rickettsiales bacterium]
MSREYSSNSRSAGAQTTDSRGSSKVFFRKNKGCSMCSTSAPAIDYKDPELLKGFISEGGRMLPSRITSICSKHQRPLKKAIKHSRVLALLPFVLLNK